MDNTKAMQRPYGGDKVSPMHGQCKANVDCNQSVAPTLSPLLQQSHDAGQFLPLERLGTLKERRHTAPVFQEAELLQLVDGNCHQAKVRDGCLHVCDTNTSVAGLARQTAVI